MKLRLEGIVLLEAIVLADGSVGAVCIVRALDPDLDMEAVAAAKRWQFIPGTKDGEPVPVTVAMELTFLLGM